MHRLRVHRHDREARARAGRRCVHAMATLLSRHVQQQRTERGTPTALPSNVKPAARCRLYHRPHGAKQANTSSTAAGIDALSGGPGRQFEFSCRARAHVTLKRYSACLQV